MAWLIIFPLHLITFKLRFTAYASHFFCFIDVMHACMCGLSRCVHAKVSMATCVCALVSVYALACAASNIDTRFPLLKTGADGTLFGLSVALHLDLKSRTHLWVTSDLAFVELDTHTHTHKTHKKSTDLCVFRHFGWSKFIGRRTKGEGGAWCAGQSNRGRVHLPNH